MKKPKKKKALPTKKQASEIHAKRAQAYADMENSVGEIVSMGELALNCFDSPDGAGSSSSPSVTSDGC